MARVMEHDLYIIERWPEFMSRARGALSEAIVGKKNGHRHMPETRDEDWLYVVLRAQIVKRPKIGDHKVVGMKKQPQMLIWKCEVIAILVLYGLPRFCGLIPEKGGKSDVENKLGEFFMHQIANDASPTTAEDSGLPMLQLTNTAYSVLWSTFV
ncbi:hypothetical protein MLD38_002650 [Melastoma candidum]|uniref:Uncharacterized protein n=1 Tax=Melastoma candidum TaxID=119954 RepID=A0ACB9S8K4_9MYRT|nr:hypothetical protein MLD38_002650 [Melastoma candidum]